MQDFRFALRRRSLRLLPGKQMPAHAGLQATGTAGALRHGGLTDTLCDQPGQPGFNVKQRHALQTAIHNHPDPFNRQTGFSDIGRQHDFAPAGLCRQDRLLLLSQRKCAVQRADRNLLRHVFFQQSLQALYLPDAGQKHQLRSGFLLQQP